MRTTNHYRSLANERITFSESPDGLPLFKLRGDFGSARFSPQGAHLMDFTPASQPPLLFLSKKTKLTPGNAIRGGVPIIFPWFGPRVGHPESPMHGLVRTRVWEVMTIEVPDRGPAKIRMSFEANSETQALWPHFFTLTLEFVLGEALTVRWETRNTGQAPFEFEQALHPYFPVADVKSASVEGLRGAEYLDKTDALRLKRDTMDSVVFSGETDRLYFDTQELLTLKDPASSSEIIVEKTGSKSSVVWNPWIDKSATLSDLEDDEWKEFVCVEQANAARNSVLLPAGCVHIFEAKYARKPIC